MQKGIILCTIILWTVLTLVGLIQRQASLPSLAPRPNLTGAGLKTILFYTKCFESEDCWFGFGQGPFIEAKCPVSNCYATNDETLLGRYISCCTMLVIFNGFYKFQDPHQTLMLSSFISEIWKNYLGSLNCQIKISDKQTNAM